MRILATKILSLFCGAHYFGTEEAAVAWRFDAADGGSTPPALAGVSHFIMRSLQKVANRRSMEAFSDGVLAITITNRGAGIETAASAEPLCARCMPQVPL